MKTKIEVSTNITLKCLIVLQKSGLPLYSNCYNGFCIKGAELLSGFLAAITQLPLAFGTGNELKNIELGDTKLIFSSPLTSKIIIVAGFPITHFHDSSNQKIIDHFFILVEKLVEEYLLTKTWVMPSNKELKIFEDLLLRECIQPCFEVVKRNIECPLKDTCSFYLKKDQDNTLFGNSSEVYKNPQKNEMID